MTEWPAWRERLATPLLALLILGLNLWLNAPLFMAGELPFRGSVENGYVGMARFLSQHPSVWGWNPLPYCGLPVQFIYVPGLLYAAALGIRLLPATDPDLVYRTLTALATCMGPVTLFLFATYFTRSRKWALVAALAYSLMSPSYGLFPAVEKDRGIVQLPWRVQVLAKYGEGPHNTGLTLLPLALVALWVAARKRSFASLFAAALLLAAIPLTNLVAAFALAITSLLLLLAAWGEPEFQAWRALAAAALAYLLACFWLTPSFIGIVAFNWPADSYNYTVGHQQELALAGMVLGALAIRGLFRWLRGSFYLCLVTLAAFVFGWVATSYYLFGIDVIPESRRYAIEFELFFALALVEGLRLAFASSNSTFKLCAIATIGVTLLGGALQVNSYLTQGWDRWKPVPRASTTEFQLARWIAQHPPQGRVYATGGLRFRLHSYFDIPQVGGAFETGLRNRLPVDLSFRIRDAKDLWPGEEAEDTILELKALGAEYVVVHGPKSKEYYRDFVRPERLTPAMQTVFHMDDDTIYALPPRRIAHLLRADEIPLSDVRDHHDVLRRYVAATEDTARPQLNARWVDNNTLAITGPVREGDAVSVQVNADPGWSATQDGREIAMTRDRLGFIVLHPATVAATRMELHFGATLEQHLMALVSALAWCVSLYWLWRTRRVA
ncbi:MAG: 6-pyruvoyl-tetrahydropterin synthase-related protein [Candidatus Solibacter sp.]